VDVLVISYDIADDKRRSRVADELMSYGRRIQYSVFWCTLSARQLARIEARIAELILHDQDQVLFLRLGPPEGKSARGVFAIGRRFEAPGTEPVIV
jgi:CRISPR-associated protein Cas2